MVEFANNIIENYKFGMIKINGEYFDYDIEIRWNGEVLKWWREQSHVINIEAVERAVSRNPDEIIIGTGEFGMAKVTEQVKEFIKSKGIDLIIRKTRRATEIFNEEIKTGKRVIAILHLTC